MALTDPNRTHTYLIRTGGPKHVIAEGVGCNFLISNQSAVPPVSDAKRWRQILAALDDLQMGWMRVGVIPTADGAAWDDRKQQWDFTHPHFLAVKKLGQWANRRKVDLMFDPYVVPPSFTKGKDFFASDPQAYAEKMILPIAKYFRRERLSCYRYLGLLSEKVWGPDKEGFGAIKSFYELYETVRATLDANGFSADQLGLLGPSNLSSWEWPIADFFAAGLDPDPLWVGYDQHLYLYHFDWMNENPADFMSMSEMTERYLRRYADYAHKRGKPLFISELGNMYCGRLFWGERDFDGPASHTSVLMDAELIVRALNEGVDGFLRWAFSVKGDCDGKWSLLENTAEGMSPTPVVYPMYRLLMRAVRPGATVLDSTVGAALGAFRYVFSAAVKNRDGNSSVLLINDAPGKNLNVGLQLGAPFRGKQLHRTVCDETRKGTTLPPVRVSRQGEATLMLTPSSLTTLSLRPLEAA
jgi:hypothetical protein